MTANGDEMSITHSMIMAAIASATPASPELGWLSGYWLSCDGGREVSETWTGPRGGMLLGSGMTTAANGKVSYEAMRIGPSKKGISFFANPSGQAPAEFPLKSATAQEVVFENLAHDFPQRVVYRRDGARLVGRIEGTMGGKIETMDWTYDAAELNARCPKTTP
jgi:hypothetical protein